MPDEYTPAEQFDLDILAAEEILSPRIYGAITSRRDSEAHVQSLLNFVNPPGWGFVRSKSEVAGFQSHRFRSRPVILNESGALDDWRITRLELVSLLKHPTPQIYIEASLPDLEKLRQKDVPTRAPDPFEKRALRFIKEGYDVVIDEQSDHIRMFGSLRAMKDCRQCHEVPENTLLGAFTYELRKPTASLTGTLPSGSAEAPQAQ